MNALHVAKVCHEANRAYSQVMGDLSHDPWEDSPQWQRESAVAGVQSLIDDPSLTPKELHELWLQRKTDEGWKYGIVKDAELKTHPCCVPYDQLPEKQRVKDELFQAIVRVLVPLPPGFTNR